jgi:FxsC-like protein
MGDSAWGHTDEQPYFFLSYAHTPRHDQGEVDDPDYWVTQLFGDLCRKLREILDLPQGVRPGFMDRELRPGKEWPPALAGALAACRVFVPLYSRRYFTSVHCGKEWSVFARRMEGYQGKAEDRTRFIVPALWVPVRGPFPEKAVQYQPAGFSETYADLGFYGVMKLTRYRHEYENAVGLLAKQIVEASTGTRAGKPLPPGPVESYLQVENAFDEADATGDGERRVLLTVATPDTPRRWNPYPDESSRPLAEEAADLATSLGFLPEVGGLAEHAEELRRARPTRAMVLIVDPRSVTVPESRKILKEIDDADRPWISVVVGWNPKTTGDVDVLKTALERALPHKLVDGPAASVLAIKGVPTLADFGTVVPTVLRAAERSFLRQASRAHDTAGT